MLPEQTVEYIEKYYLRRGSLVVRSYRHLPGKYEEFTVQILFIHIKAYHKEDNPIYFGIGFENVPMQTVGDSKDPPVFKPSIKFLMGRCGISIGVLLKKVLIAF